MDPNDISSLPLWAQSIAALTVILASLFAALRGYIRPAGRTDPNNANETMAHLIGASLADRHAMQALTDVLVDIAGHLKDGVEAYIRITEERIRKEATQALEDLVKEAVNQRTKPKRRTRRTT